jgi:hypothetical protein
LYSILFFLLHNVNSCSQSVRREKAEAWGIEHREIQLAGGS